MIAQTACHWLLDGMLGDAALLLAHDAQIEDREFVTLALGLVATFIAVRFRGQLTPIPGFKWWLAALLLRLASWVLTIAEEYSGPALAMVCDRAEHLSTLASTILVAIGCWAMTRTAAPESERGT